MAYSQPRFNLQDLPHMLLEAYSGVMIELSQEQALSTAEYGSIKQKPKKKKKKRENCTATHITKL